MPKPVLPSLIACGGLCASLLFGVVAHADKPIIYRWVDENGTVHYSDAPPNEQAQPADLPGITVVPARKIKPRKQDPEDTEGQQTTLFSDLRLVRPKPEESLWGTAGTVTAEVAFKDELPPGYAIRFVLDDTPLKPVRKKNLVIKDVTRGEHRLHAEIIETTSKQVVATTKPVVFYLQQVNINMRKKR